MLASKEVSFCDGGLDAWVAGAVVCAGCGALCATAASLRGVRSDELPRCCWPGAAAGLSSRAFSETARELTAWNEMGAAGAGDILDAGVAARDAGLEGPFELSTGAAAWTVETTSSAAGCAMVA